MEIKSFLVVLIVCSISSLVWSIDLHVNPCTECTAITTVLQRALGNNATDEEILNGLDKMCEKIYANDTSKLDECYKIAQEFVIDMEALDKTWSEKWSPKATCQIFNMCEVYCCITPYTPEQIHIALAESEAAPDGTFGYTVQWVTGENAETVCQWGYQSGNYTFSNNGTTTTYENGGWRGQIHRCIMSGIKPNQDIYYRVGDPQLDKQWGGGWSLPKYLNVRGPPVTKLNSNVQLAVYGDMGATDSSDATLLTLNEFMRAGKIQAIVHLGDISYADGSEGVWDDFFRKIEPIAAYMPYQTAVGNHEAWYHFESYKHRFAMPGNNTKNETGGADPPMYYSFVYGNIYFISYSCEQLYGVAPDLWQGHPQHKWLEQELSRANSPEQRAITPWVITMAHRPIYCCNNLKKCIDVGLKYYRKLLEPLFYTYHVDLVLTAHMHSYQRSYPVYDLQPTSFNYTNPTAPVYLVIGTGGNEEGLDGSFVNPPYSWSATHISEWGFGLLSTNGNSSISFEMIKAGTAEVLDSFTIRRE